MRSRYLPKLAASAASILVTSACLLPGTSKAAPGPLRVLHLGKDGSSSADHAHVLMRELGRDGIWVEYTTDPGVATAEWVSRFDAVILDASRESFPGLAAAPAERVLSLTFEGDAKAWGSPEFMVDVRGRIVGAAGDVRRQEWGTFLAQWEPERREANANIANYERRPEAITLQHPFSVKGSIERTQVAPDLRLELFAAEPDIAKPIAMAWDERGRCWVAETRDYPHEVKATGEGNDSLKICEDTDGDGKADKFTVFADRLNIPTSFVFVNGGVIVAQPPRFLFLKDTDGDDKADVRQVVLEGWGIGDTHAQANSLHYGLDNWLYGCVGYSGYKGYVGGRELDFRMGTFRFKADGSALEFLHQFSNNSWGHSANAAGDQFGGTANGAPIFYGGIPATAYATGARGMTAKKINLEDKAHTITPNFRQVDVFGGYTAAAGSAFIESANLPPRLQGKAMVCEPTMKIIALMDVQPSGAGYIARDGFNLVASSDEWMSPVFAEVGPDGAVWFADWQNFIIQHNPTPNVARGGYDAQTGVGGAHINPLRDHLRGRIYRVAWEKAKPSSIRSLRQASTRDLLVALGHDNPHWRLTAQRLLVEGRKTDAVPELRALATSTNTSVAAVHALWTLAGLGQLDDATHRAALLSRDPALRRNAVRALASDPQAQARFFSAGVISDPDLVTRLAALVKLADFPTTPEIQTVVASVSRNPIQRSDAWLSEAVNLLARRHGVSLHREGPNLLPNPSLETLGTDGLPEGWKRRDYGDRPANRSAVWSSVNGTENVHSGERAVRCVAAGSGEADTSLYADVMLKPNTQYRLAGWVRGKNLRGRLSFNDHINRVETERVTKDGDWSEVEAVFNSGNATRGSINILFVARGEGSFDDVRLVELLPAEDPATQLAAGDVVRGEHIFFKHAAACVYCHQLRGQGSTVGPALDGIAARKDVAYLRESILEPSKVLAQGYENLSMSPMPPMGDVLTPQELADIQAFLQTLK
jgi:putative membrane-bound dehydrogenase-like protein